MNKVHTDATNKVYLSQWRLFEGWCLKRGIDPLQATSVCICDFFLYLFNDRKLQVKTIEGYKSAVTFILKRSSGYDLSECDIAADMLRSFKLERPHTVRTEVRWDVSVVLSYLVAAVHRGSDVSEVADAQNGVSLVASFREATIGASRLAARFCVFQHWPRVGDTAATQ